MFEKNSLIIKWPSLIQKNGKNSLTTKKKFYRIGHPYQNPEYKITFMNAVSVMLMLILIPPCNNTVVLNLFWFMPYFWFKNNLRNPQIDKLPLWFTIAKIQQMSSKSNIWWHPWTTLLCRGSPVENHWPRPKRTHFAIKGTWMASL